MTLLWILCFVVAGGVGAFLRYLVLAQWNIHWSILMVNLLGSLLFGFFAVFLDPYPQARWIVLVAFLGSLTTFSSYAFDLVRLFEQGSIGQALLYLLLSNGLCFAGCYIGFKSAQSWVISV